MTVLANIQNQTNDDAAIWHKSFNEGVSPIYVHVSHNKQERDLSSSAMPTHLSFSVFYHHSALMSLNSLKHSAQLQRREMKMTECFTATPSPHHILSVSNRKRERNKTRARGRVGWRWRKAKGRTIICWATQNREKRLQSINSYTISLWAMLMLCRPFSTVCVKY